MQDCCPRFKVELCVLGGVFVLRLFWLKSVVDEFAGDGERFDLVWVKVLLEKGLFFCNLGELLVDVSER